MKKKLENKFALTLKKNTVANLNNHDMNVVRGGIVKTDECEPVDTVTVKI